MPTSSIQPHYVSVDAFAVASSLSRATIYRLLKSNDLPSIFNRRRLIPLAQGLAALSGVNSGCVAPVAAPGASRLGSG